ncbi:hypothetical protein PRIPAC_89482 [Pristionchus pacificus]|uniref:FR47 domain-containing protein n=1 Tax=Pristionchus pacificus TaxID=54126 RepID=A0A2A6CY95_PRIPA|nr:hypothetical protein PRIPAC_89482 [Pristionchus pacificus]|eukprot:PDM83108.1 hypothetical protein PRIPAC_37501 [Pristionchus pacificus]
MISADQPTADAFESAVAEIFDGKAKRSGNCNCGMFYMTKAQRDELTLGFTLQLVNVARDGDTIHTSWKNGISLDITKARLSSFPAITARDKNDNLAGWAISGRFGQISNEFVVPEHRGIGLGRAVELVQAQQLARKGRRVFKYVEITNEIVFNTSLRSSNWTMWRENGERKPIYFRKFEIAN